MTHELLAALKLLWEAHPGTTAWRKAMAHAEVIIKRAEAGK